MINKRINKVEAKGENIFVFQYIDSAGNKTEEKRSLEEFLKPFIGPNEERIKELKVHLADKTELLGYKDSEVIKLSEEIQTLKGKNEELEKQISQFLGGMEGKELSQTSNLYQAAFELFTEGEIDQAILILDDAKMEEEENQALDEMKQRAETRLLKAKMLKLKNLHKEASVNYEKAVELFQSWGNCLEAADYFKFVDRFDKAEKYYNYCIDKAGNEEEKATTLNNLANLHRAKNEYKKAEANYLEALEIRRKQVKVNSSKTFLSNLADTLNNFGILQNAKNEYKKAGASYMEALEVRRKLAAIDPEKYLPDVGMILNNIGLLKNTKREYKKAEESFHEALEIYRKLAVINRQTYLPNVAVTLNNLGILQFNKKESKKAESSYMEALDIFRNLAKGNPQTYLSKVGRTLNNLGFLISSTKENSEAESSYMEALDIFRNLAEVNPQAYLPCVADTLNNLANLHRVLGGYKKAEATYMEALEIRTNYAELVPKAFKIELADTFLCLSILYRYNLENRILCVKYAKKAAIIYSTYSVPHAVQWGKVAQENIDFWKDKKIIN